jgi:2-oxoglutarate dehydrogenase E1 component
MHRVFRKPLVVITPKSLLRHKSCVSKLADMELGSSFHRVLWDGAQLAKGLAADADIKRVVLCAGKVYYDLMAEREKRGIRNIYLLRLEQLYPFPEQALAEELARFAKAEIVWCQEEPKNQGAWTFVAPRVEAVLAGMGRKDAPRYVGRSEGASPASGRMSQHQAELAAFLDEALTL